MVLSPQLIQYLVLGQFFWLIVLTVFLVRSILHYNRLTKNITKKDLKNVLNELLTKADLNQKEITSVEADLKKIKENIKSHIQKIGFVRFNPFPQTGGDQSCCFSLLDEKGNGFVLSSLHSRESTRVYSKTIKNGKPEGFKLSKEEQQAINNAK